MNYVFVLDWFRLESNSRSAKMFRIYRLVYSLLIIHKISFEFCSCLSNRVSSSSSFVCLFMFLIPIFIVFKFRTSFWNHACSQIEFSRSPTKKHAKLFRLHHETCRVSSCTIIAMFGSIWVFNLTWDKSIYRFSH